MLVCNVNVTFIIAEDLPFCFSEYLGLTYENHSITGTQTDTHGALTQ